MNSTWRESTAIVFALDSFLPPLKRFLHQMVFLTVNMFCVIVESNWKCNGLPELCLIGRILLVILLMQTIGKSQLPFSNSWIIHRGHIQWTAFVIFYNKKVNKLYSGLWKPGCSGVDFFVQNLTGENCVLVPR